MKTVEGDEMGIIDGIKNKIPFMKKKEEEYTPDIGAFPETPEATLPGVGLPGAVPPELQLGVKTQLPSQAQTEDELIKSKLELLSTKIDSIKLMVERIEQRLTYIENLIGEKF
jgi:hypothetical protein